MHRERNKIWFKISSNEDRRSNIYIEAPLKKNLNIEISTMLFCKFLRNKGLSQNVGLFHLGTGLA